MNPIEVSFYGSPDDPVVQKFLARLKTGKWSKWKDNGNWWTFKRKDKVLNLRFL
jgi:GH24 family phage-related lysozyme (muramidase)